jgi:hypothetical protein
MKDGWYTGGAPGLGAASRRCGGLDYYVRRKLAPMIPRVTLVPASLREAYFFLSDLDALSFVVADLLPYLQTLAATSTSAVGPMWDPPSEWIREFLDRGRKLWLRFDAKLVRLGSPEQLARWIGAPCALVDRNVIPLMRVSRARRKPGSSFLKIGGELYTFRYEKARRIHEFQQAFIRRAVASAKRELLRADDLCAEAATFVEDLRSILPGAVRNCRNPYEVLYRDGHHEVQYSRGSWILVRGPVPLRIGTGSIFLGLHLRGAGRKHLLSHALHRANSADGFWSTSPDLSSTWICMGDPEQYKHLVTPAFTDPEAIVNWLDAGVIVATGRSDLHRSLRRSRRRRRLDDAPRADFIRHVFEARERLERLRRARRHDLPVD